MQWMLNEVEEKVQKAYAERVQAQVECGEALVDYDVVESQILDISNFGHHVMKELLEDFEPIIMKWIEDNPNEVSKWRGRWEIMDQGEEVSASEESEDEREDPKDGGDDGGQN